MLIQPETIVKSHGARNGASDPIRIAGIAANVSAQGATGGGATVATPTERPPIASDSNQDVTLANTKRHTGAARCEHCGEEFTPRRPHGRFCGAYCRRLAWLERNPEKAAILAERDRQRLREHVIAAGGEWRE